jgi:DNA-binding FrmR family transcriptional regulator
MEHTIEEKKKLLNRVRRIMGQVAAIEKALDQERSALSSSTILRLAGAAWMR